MIVDALSEDGTWDQRNSMMLEMQLGAWDSFSMIPGAPSTAKVPVPAATNGKSAPPAAVAAPAPTPKPAPAPPAVKEEPKGPPLRVAEVDSGVVLVFPQERFSLDVAAALGKHDWDNVIRRSDNLSGAQRDKMQRDGANWIAPLEFLSEVFIDGKPLSKPQFEKDSQPLDGVKIAARSLPAVWRGGAVRGARQGPVRHLADQWRRARRGAGEVNKCVAR